MFSLTRPAKSCVPCFEELYENRDENFGNARTVRNLFEDAISRQADRLAAADKPTRDDLMTLLPEDLEDNE